MALNVYLAEQADKVSNIKDAVSDIKKLLNTCKLSKFKSAESCGEFYLIFFTNSTPDKYSDLSFADWFDIYNQLFSQPQFKANLVFFISLFQPTHYDGMFKPLIAEIEREAYHAKEKMYFYSDVKAKLTQLRSDFAGVCQSALSQTVSQEPVQFCKAIDGVFSDMIARINKEQEALLLERDEGDGIRKVVRPYPMTESAVEDDDTPLDEDVQEAKEFVSLLESFDLYAIMNEDISDKLADLRDSAEYQAMVTEDKVASGARNVANAVNSFDRKVSTWIDRFRNYRKNKKIKAMLGETHHVMREILRITGAIVAGAVAPKGTSKLFRSLIGIVIYFGSWYLTGKTTEADLRKFIEMVKDELEIVEKKIEQAERQGDDKGVVQLIRMRQKLQHQLDGMMRKAYSVTYNVKKT